MQDIPDYVTFDRIVEVTVELPDESRKTFNSSYDHIIFVDVRDEGVWIRTENNQNMFYPFSQVLEMKVSSSGDEIPEHLQKQRRK